MYLLYWSIPPWDQLCELSVVITKSLVLIVEKILFHEIHWMWIFTSKTVNQKTKVNQGRRTNPAPVSCKFEAEGLMDSCPFSTVRSVSSQISLSLAHVSVGNRSDLRLNSIVTTDVLFIVIWMWWTLKKNECYLLHSESLALCLAILDTQLYLLKSLIKAENKFMCGMETVYVGTPAVYSNCSIAVLSYPKQWWLKPIWEVRRSIFFIFFLFWSSKCLYHWKKPQRRIKDG